MDTSEQILNSHQYYNQFQAYSGYRSTPYSDAVSSYIQECKLKRYIRTLSDTFLEKLGLKVYGEEERPSNEDIRIELDLAIEKLSRNEQQRAQLICETEGMFTFCLYLLKEHVYPDAIF